jgi:tetratricopeptide (TPR) repeat protein
MAKIPLRTYIQEIDRQIISNRIDEAIAHSRYILQTYSRYIAVYRLLGKAYSEAKRYGDAADIFQRVLSSIPEDKVSHVGMSIIREDEGNLNEAIWHMEMAFEVDPSNSAIQDELRRLIAKRDGMEPPRIRLTRGALARMYIKGDLVQEAVSELRIALAEDSNRLDLKVLLANSLARLGQRVEAVEIANQILRKLPNNLDANRIMAELLTGTERDEEAQNYRQIVCSLDPYYSFVNPANPIVEQVPDQAITLERLEWKLGQPQPGIADQPAWATSLGIKISDQVGEKETLPDWLAGEPETPPAEPAIPESVIFAERAHLEEEAIPNAEIEQPAPDRFQENLIEPEAKEIFAAEQISGEPKNDEIPSWMEEAGWEPVTADQVQATPPEGEETMPAEEEEPMLDQTEIPEWLKGIVVAETTATIFSSDKEESAPPVEAPVDSAAAGLAAQAASEAVEGPAENPPEAGGTTIPAWLPEEAEIFGESIESKMPENATGEALPDWVFEKEPSYSSESQLPPWLSEPPEDENQIEDAAKADIEPAKGLPDWLFVEDSSQAAEAELAAGSPDWLMEENLPPELIPEGAAPADEMLTTEIPGWLFEEKTSTEAEAAPEIKSIFSDEVAPAQESSQPAETAPEEEMPVAHPVAALTLPAWLLANKESSTPASPAAAEIPEEPAPANSLDQEPELTGLVAGEKSSTIPAWLYEEELGELPLKEGDTEPSKSSKQKEISQPEEPASAVPAWILEAIEEPPVIQAAAEPVIAEGSFEPLAEEFAWENPPEGTTGVIPAWLLEEEVEARIESVSTPSESGGGEIFAASTELETPPEIAASPEISTKAEMPEPAVPTFPEPEAAVSVEPELGLPDWLFESAPEPDLVQEMVPEPVATEMIPEPATSEMVQEPATGEMLPEPAASEMVQEVRDILEQEPPELASARLDLSQNNLNQAIEMYSILVESNMYLPEIIQDLQGAIEKYPDNPAIWQSLGDAYLRTDQTQDALDAYLKAQNLLV